MILYDVRCRIAGVLRVCCGLLLSAFVLPEVAHACTRFPFGSSVGAGSAYFLAAALPDTVFAGDGGIDYVMHPGHSGRAAQRTVYGQIFHVERMGGPAVASLPAGTDRVVLVPWDYDAACRPVPWALSARWAPTEDVAFYGAKLRAPEHWADGLPTFDVRAPELEGYPYWRRPPRAFMPGSPDSLMTAEQVFELYDALPLFGDVRQRDFAALEELRAWVAAHPDLAPLYPAEFILFGAQSSAERALRDRTDHPLLGTWRFAFRIDGGEPRAFYGRTRAHLAGVWDPQHTPPQRTLPTLQPGVPVGYSFTTSTAPSLDGLPLRTHGHDAEAHFYALTQPEVQSADSVVWRGAMDLWLVSRTFPNDAQLDALQKQWFADFKTQHEQGHVTPARFVRYADGRLRVEAAIELSTGTVIDIQGEQLSRETIPPPD